jgi:hypothetical protein
MDFRAMMHIHARAGGCGTQNPPYLRMRLTAKQTDKPNASVGDGVKAVSQRGGVSAGGKPPRFI